MTETVSRAEAKEAQEPFKSAAEPASELPLRGRRAAEVNVPVFKMQVLSLVLKKLPIQPVGPVSGDGLASSDCVDEMQVKLTGARREALLNA